MQPSQLQDRLEELKGEIERLEAVENLSSEEFAQLKSHKAEIQTIESQLDSDLAQKNFSIRRLERRDIQMLQRLVKDYPGFRNLDPGSQLDRMALLLTEACGFGGVMLSTIDEAGTAISFRPNLDVLEHFKNAQWTNREGETRKRYVNNFADAYKLDPGFRLKLLHGERDSQDNEIVRKVVKPRPETIAARAAEQAKPPPRVIQTVKSTTSNGKPTTSSSDSVPMSTAPEEPGPAEDANAGVGEKLKRFFKKISSKD